MIVENDEVIARALADVSSNRDKPKLKSANYYYEEIKRVYNKEYDSDFYYERIYYNSPYYGNTVPPIGIKLNQEEKEQLYRLGINSDDLERPQRQFKSEKQFFVWLEGLLRNGEFPTFSNNIRQYTYEVLEMAYGHKTVMELREDCRRRYWRQDVKQ